MEKAVFGSEASAGRAIESLGAANRGEAAAPPAALPAPKAAGAWLPGEGIGVGEIGGSGCPGGGMVSPASDAYGPVCGVIEGGADGPVAVKPFVAGVVAAGGAVP